MKKLQTYQKVAIIVVIVGMLGAIGVRVFVEMGQANRNPMIVKYEEVMKALSLEEEPYHAKENIMITDATGAESGYYNEFYSEHKQFLWIQGYEDGNEYHNLVYGEHDYSYGYNPNSKEEYYVNKGEGSAGQWERPLNSIAKSYYFVIEKNVSYEETEEQYIVTYNNTQRVNQAVQVDKAATSPIKEAVMVSYFDKEWNIEKIVVTEKWDSAAEDGTEYERVETTTITYFDTSEVDIQARIEEEHKFLEQLLEK